MKAGAEVNVSECAGTVVHLFNARGHLIVERKHNKAEHEQNYCGGSGKRPV
ncbi:hypothetical protein SDC9_176287 [bioreactor metagenome]|uniref:Uncharacterized protein n=1 Tax=bioreactor metagenome TaxID=1076179 RepID=A0A645GSB9_9ZZZZ